MLGRLVERLRLQIIRIGLGVAIMVVFLLHSGQYINIEFIDEMEYIAYDSRLLFNMPRTINNQIVIVDIDEKSLAMEGHWPWPRDRLALLLEQLFDNYRIKVIGFDMVFPEPDTSSGLKVLEGLAETALASDLAFRSELQRLRSSLDYDSIFADAVRRYPVVLGYAFAPTQTGEMTNNGQLPNPTFEANVFRGRPIAFERGASFISNTPQLQDAARAAGHFVPYIDVDGTIRRVPMLYEHDGGYYESLSLAVARTALGELAVTPEFAPVPAGARHGYSGLEWLRIGKHFIPVDDTVSSLVPYRGTQGSYHYVSATDVIHGNVDPALLNGTIALLGTTAAGLLDMRSTPVLNSYAGVEIHANLIDGILNDTIKQNPPYVLGAEIVILFLQGLFMAVVLPLLSPLWATAVTVGLFALAIGTNFAIWQYADLAMPLASGLIMFGAMFLLNMSYGYFVETRGKRQLTGLFGQYVPPELVDEMSERPESYSLDAESRNLTVLFTDMRGFTTISEGLPPKDLSQLMDGFLTPMTRLIHDNRGTIDKYMGDAIMAFWGAPISDPDHARHALETGMRMVASLDQINQDFKGRGWPEIRIGVGINTGEMSVGNMGSEFRMAYTVLGDAVNLGSRLEGLTKGYGVSIMVSESTRAAVPEFAYRELDRVRVKGKDEPVAIYEPLVLTAQIPESVKDELALYREALKLYREQQWDMAEMQFINLQEMSTSPMLYKIYAERIVQYRANPPGEDWDGVFTHTSK